MVNAGQISVIKPNVAHAMVFTKDNIFKLSKRKVTGNYGIAHTKNMYSSKRKRKLHKNIINLIVDLLEHEFEKGRILGYQPLNNL